MANPMYTSTGEPAEGTRGDSSKIRTQFTGIQQGFDAIEHVFSLQMDISSARSWFVPVPWACDVTEFCCALQTVFAGADNTLTLEIGGTPVTDSTITITQSGAAIGDYDEAVASPIVAANSVAAGGTIEIISNGGSTTSPTYAWIFLTLKRTA